MATLSVFSDTADGRVQSTDATYNTARTGSNLAAVDTVIGDSARWQLFSGDYLLSEQFFPFDTSSLGSGANVSDAELSVYVYNLTSDDGWDSAYVREYDFGASVDTGDWRATNGTSVNDTLLATLARTSATLNSYNAFSSETAFADAIVVTGTTRMYVLINDIEAATAPTGNNFFGMKHADETGTTQDPKLVVTYTTTPEIGIAGNLPAMSGSIVPVRPESVAGNLPSQSGLITPQQTLGRDVAGSLPAQSGALGVAQDLARALEGNLPAMNGAISGVLKLFIDLTGSLPAQNGTLEALFAKRHLSGILPAMEGLLTFDHLLQHVALTGSLPAMSGDLAVNYLIAVAGSLPAMNGALTSVQAQGVSGILPAQQGSLAYHLVLGHLSLSGELPAMSGLLTADVLNIRLAGELPAMSGALGEAFKTRLWKPPQAGTGRFVPSLPGSGRFVSTKSAVGRFRRPPPGVGS